MARRSARLQQRACQSLSPHDSSSLDAQRKRDTSDEPVRKRPRSSPGNEEEEGINPIDYWRTHQRWPRKLFKSDSNMDPPRDSRKASTSSATSSDTTREKRSKPYHNPAFWIVLQINGSFPDEYTNGPVRGSLETSTGLCKQLLALHQDIPRDSLFSDEFFVETCEMLQDGSEAKITQDISRLIVPSAESLAIRGSKHLDILIESVKESWIRSIPVHRDFPQPKPDYSVGFRWSAFTSGQLEKLNTLFGSISERSTTPYTTTRFMCFPFLTCEVMCGAVALDVADRQNAHSATIAVRNIVGLFKLIEREKELHREILAFSISHDNSTVRIYGHYPIIDEKDTKYCRHEIRNFVFRGQDGKERWTAYKFTKNVYDNWMPPHFKRICNAIDEIPPGISFGVPRLRSTSSSPELENLPPS